MGDVDAKPACPCGAPLPPDPRDSCEVRLGPRVAVRVCASLSRTEPHAKLSCVLAFVKARRRCCGCDRPVGLPGALCADCSAALSDHWRRLQIASEAGAGEAAETAVLPERALRGHDRRPDAGNFLVPDECAREFGDALRDLVLGAASESRRAAELRSAPRWTEPHWEHYDRGFAAPLTAFQAGALARMFGAVRDVARRCREEGYRFGSSALMRLATGDLSVLEFERAAGRNGPR